MKKVGHTIYVWLWGSNVTIRRALYEDSEHFYVKWYGEFIQVSGMLGCTRGWKSVEAY